MESLLSDIETHKIVSRNPLKYLQNKVHQILSQLNDDAFLEYKNNKLSITQTNTTSVRAYGSLKIHKTGFRLRPVISLINSPTYFLSKVLVKNLKKCIELPKSYIKNSSFLIKKKGI